MLTMILVILILLMIAAASVRPIGSELSNFELQRRVEAGDKAALKLWRRKDLYRSIIKLQLSLQLIVLVIIAVVATVAFGWPLAILLAVIVGLWHQQPARLFHKLTQPQYRKFEDKLLDLIEKIQPLLKTIFIFKNSLPAPGRIASRQELLHVIDINLCGARVLEPPYHQPLLFAVIQSYLARCQLAEPKQLRS